MADAPTIPTEIKTSLDRFAAIAEALKTNPLVKTAEEKMDEYLKDSSFTSDKKGEIYASFYANIATANTAKCLDIAFQFPLLDAQIKAAEQQTANEKLRGEDIKGGIIVKKMQAFTAWMSAKYEEARRKVLVRADANNGKIKKAVDGYPMLIQGLKNAGFDITSSELLTLSKSAMEAIDTTELSFVSEISDTDKPDFANIMTAISATATETTP